MVLLAEQRIFAAVGVAGGWWLVAKVEAWRQVYGTI